MSNGQEQREIEQAPLSASQPQAAPLRGWKRLGFYALNGMIFFHLVAVCSSPMSAQPSSRVQQNLWWVCHPYVQVLYQNNGFHFFAPNPEGSNSVIYRVELADGKVQEGKFPNRNIFPRLLYHRHFMLSENLGSLNPEEQSRMARAFARRLCEKYQGEKVSISLEWHELALRERILAGGSLFDEDLYRVTPLGTFTWDELSASSATNSSVTSVE